MRRKKLAKFRFMAKIGLIDSVLKKIKNRVLFKKCVEKIQYNITGRGWQAVS